MDFPGSFEFFALKHLDYWKMRVLSQFYSTELNDVGPGYSVIGEARNLQRTYVFEKPQRNGGLVGLTVMNEPAHLNSGENFASEDDVLRW